MRSQKIRITKRIAICFGGIALAIVVGLQTASLIVERTTPDVALQLNSKNGKALGRKAFQEFSQLIAEGRSQEEAAREVADTATQALRYEPLLPQAHAILALAADTREKRKAILEPALKLNRRSATLLGLSLQEELADQNTEGVIATLDLILRVHPETSAEFFPLLAGALADDQSLPIFERILASKPPWQDQFLLAASANAEAVVNAAQLRRSVTVENENLDAALIARLTAAQKFEAAQQHYAFLEKRVRRDTSMALRSEYPPIDWRFSDTREKRAQLSRGGDAIEFFVRPGAGGILMERIVPLDGDELDVSIDYDLDQSSQLQNVRLQANCADNATPLVDQNFDGSNGEMHLQISRGDCDFMRLVIYARVPSGNPALRGSISNFSAK